MSEIELTRSEKSTILYLESCAVDGCGRVESRRINNDDLENITKFKKWGLVEYFARIPFHQVEQFANLKSKNIGIPTHFVILSCAGFSAAWKARKERADGHQPIVNEQQEREVE